MYLADYHTHSDSSPDGRATIARLAEAALARGLDEICVTDHVDTVYWGSNAPRWDFDWDKAQRELAEARQLLQELSRAEQYVGMVMVYLRLTDGGSDFVLRTCDLDAIVRQAVRRFAGEFITRKLKLCYEPLNAACVTDEKWLLFVVEQVLSNALKYTREGSITITMEHPKTLVIRDTGIGIAPEDLPRVFERGYTGKNGRLERRSTGIGLFLCREVCRRLGHGITIASRPGEGTEVRLDLHREKLEAE